jgi:predicted protein tyrosine phosphatase
MHHPCFAVAFRDLAAAAARVQPRLVISIADPGQEPSVDALAKAAPGAAVVRLSYNADQGHGSTWVTVQDIHTVHMAVIDQPEDATVLVHCGAGSMRSPAMALVVRAIQAGFDSDRPIPLEDIVAAWSKDHPHAEPHMRTLGCADAYFHSRRGGFERTVLAHQEARHAAAQPVAAVRKPLYGAGSKTRLKGFRP